MNGGSCFCGCIFVTEQDIACGTPALCFTNAVPPVLKTASASEKFRFPVRRGSNQIPLDPINSKNQNFISLLNSISVLIAHRHVDSLIPQRLSINQLHQNLDSFPRNQSHILPDRRDCPVVKIRNIRPVIRNNLKLLRHFPIQFPRGLQK